MEKAKKRSTLLVSLLVALVLGAMCLFAGCESDEDQIRKVLNNSFTVNDDVVSSVASSFTGDENVDKLGIDAQEFAKQIFEGYSYSIDSVTVNGNSAKADVTVTVRDLQPVLDSYSEAVTNYASTLTTQPSEDELYKHAGELLMQALQDTPADKTVSSTVTIDLTKDGSTWKVADEDAVTQELTQALFGHITSMN